MSEEDEEYTPPREAHCMICDTPNSVLTIKNVRRMSDHKTVGYMCSSCEQRLLNIAQSKVNLRLYMMARGWRCVYWYGAAMWSKRELQISNEPLSLAVAAELQLKEDLQSRGT
jgi:uncharacterized protein YlaI